VSSWLQQEGKEMTQYTPPAMNKLGMQLRFQNAANKFLPQSYFFLEPHGIVVSHLEYLLAFNQEIDR